MLGSGSLLIFFLLTANPGDAGVATISDQSPATEAADSSDNGKATLVNYTGVASSLEAEEFETDQPSLMQTMLLEQEQGQIPRQNPF